MKQFAALTMIVGILVSSSSIVFTIIDGRYNNSLVVLYWVLLSGFELFFAWTVLFSKPKTFRRSQKITLLALLVLVGVWIFFVSNDVDAKVIFIWALKILNSSGLYFVGLFIFYREHRVSKNE